MKTRWLTLVLFCLAARLAVATTNGLSKAEIEGRQLAQQLREMRPAENSSLTGVVIMVRPKLRPRVVEVPVEFKTTVTATNWQTEYIARGTNAETTTVVTIQHADGEPTVFRIGADTLPGGTASMTPFAGSDFWLSDLGLEFLHWPGQHVINKEMKSGEACDVLESTNPAPPAGGYAKIVSWVDQDTGGIVQAWAYDARGRKLKFFEPKGFTKVRGQWQVDEMRINNEQTGTYTRLKFKFDEK